MRKKCAQNKLRRESKTLKVKNMNKKILEDEQEVRSFSVLYESHKGFKEKKAIKNYMRWCFNSVGIYLETISFIWLNSVVPGVPNLKLLNQNI